MSFAPRRSARVLGAGVLAVLLAGSLVACGDDHDDDAGDDERVVTISHPATPDPTYIDLGDPGESVGDQRIFNFDGEDQDGNIVNTNWLMTTTASDVVGDNVETRNVVGVIT